MIWKLEIKKVANGYILKGKFANGDIVEELIIEESEKEFNKLETIKRVLQEVKEYFGIYHSKHNQENLEIEIKRNSELEIK